MGIRGVSGIYYLLRRECFLQAALPSALAPASLIDCLRSHRHRPRIRFLAIRLRRNEGLRGSHALDHVDCLLLLMATGGFNTCYVPRLRSCPVGSRRNGAAAASVREAQRHRLNESTTWKITHRTQEGVFLARAANRLT